jgi:hypothetical protein
LAHFAVKLFFAGADTEGIKIPLEAIPLSVPTNIGISRLGQIAINVHDIERAIKFYRDILGLPLLFTAGKLAFFNCGGVRLMLDTPEKPSSIIPVRSSTSPYPTLKPRIGGCGRAASPSKMSHTSSPKCRTTISG